MRFSTSRTITCSAGVFGVRTVNSKTDRSCLVAILDARRVEGICLVYAISCRRCSAVYIGETGRTLRERFGEHLRSIEKSLPGFPVAEHFNLNGHALQDVRVRGVMLCDGNKYRKRQEMCLIFKLGTSQPHGLNSNFKYL